MDIVLKYFPELNDLQRERFARLLPLYRAWNEKINVISRKDMNAFYEHHVLHSLAIAKVFRFLPQAAVLDLGAGGGIPGIPLAIYFPQTQFVLVDSIGKKMKVADAIVAELQLANVSTRHARAETLRERFDFVVSRGVASLDKLLLWSRPLLSKKHRHAMPNGLIALKGGNLAEETSALPPHEYTEIWRIANFFGEPFFEEKKVVYVQG